MLTDYEKKRQADACGWSDEQRTDSIREGVKKKYRLEDELAITRKMLKRVFDLVVELHGREISDEVITEFKKYFEDVEKIKEEVGES